MLKLRSSAGYTLVELAVSMSIMLVVMGAIFSLVNPAAGTARVQPEFADMQQRARVGVEALFKDLVIAGAGPYMKTDTNGPQTGSLMNFFAPILPYRTGKIAPDDPGSFKTDTITIVYVPNTPSQTSIRQEMPQNSAELKVEPQDNAPSNCPQKNPMCGFHVGDGLLIFDKNGKGFDTFEITQVQAPALHLQHRGKDNTLSTTYAAGSMITQVQSHTYYFDAAQNQLRHYDGLQTDVPILDNVVGLEFTYYGDPNPPLGPKPVVGEQNCVIDMAGDPRLPVLTADSGSLVKLPGSLFSTQDNPPDLCGGGNNAYDPDLLRIRKVEVRIRVQTGDATMRGTDARFFIKPGHSTGAMVPDYELRFEVSPRNMNLVR